MREILKAENLSKDYLINKKKFNVLRNINISINVGDFVSVMGPSGSGKSTLLYNVSGMDKMSSGEVVFQGEKLSELSEKKLSGLRLKKMGFVFQQINLLNNLGILDNIIFPAQMEGSQDRKKVKQRAVALMKKIGIIELAENEITQASGGQLQRAAICRALINEPEILFADEPTGALNSKSAKEVMDVFHTINKEGTTVMIVTHDIRVASHSSRVIFMKDGNIIGEKVLGELKDLDIELKDREGKLSKWLLDLGF
ncbi:putative ABC transport system ATP-binding protein [Halanaerobium saccharolyticum]|uniref:Putative ABC transport system ATP-binding protein n=1 Tax=Halanaerobium saccharolyticum TaxID=43595 RepID=A0A4R6LBW8_9FIRM|nr:ABC transporter ATP-binding protein [Halanaerobium saccharolyticum]TDO73388.1 putative ABC transport system ATP-binding protein [Halanaerobium saccharolyticum]